MVVEEAEHPIQLGGWCGTYEQGSECGHRWYVGHRIDADPVPVRPAASVTIRFDVDPDRIALRGPVRERELGDAFEIRVATFRAPAEPGVHTYMVTAVRGPNSAYYGFKLEVVGRDL